MWSYSTIQEATMATFTDRWRENFNGDGGSQGDVLWRDHGGNNVLWLIHNNTPLTIATLPFVTPDWDIKAAVEFNDAGSPFSDILWQNNNGSLALWQMNGATPIAIVALPNVGPTWHVMGANDFNGNTAAD